MTHSLCAFPLLGIIPILFALLVYHSTFSNYNQYLYKKKLSIEIENLNIYMCVCCFDNLHEDCLKFR